MNPLRAKRLTRKSLRLLEAVAASERRGEFPLVRELAQSLGYKGEDGIEDMLNRLVNEGYLQKHGGGKERRQRIYRLTPKAHCVLAELDQEPNSEHNHHPNTDHNCPAGVPVLGMIPAGPLAEAVQECEEWIDPGDSLRVQAGDFFLRIKGKSMTGDGILPGDLVLIRPSMQINNGEIAAVQMHSSKQSEATLKHIHYQPGKKSVRLRASNPAYGEVVLPASEVEVVGAYRGLLRRLEPKSK